jgi:hypothetical protein
MGGRVQRKSIWGGGVRRTASRVHRRGQVTRGAPAGRPAYLASDHADNSDDDAAGRSERGSADPSTRPATGGAAPARRGSGAASAAAAALGRAVGVEKGGGKRKKKGGGASGGRIDARFQWMAYGLAFVWYMACAYMSVLYGLSFTNTIQAPRPAPSNPGCLPLSHYLWAPRFAIASSPIPSPYRRPFHAISLLPISSPRPLRLFPLSPPFPQCNVLSLHPSPPEQDAWLLGFAISIIQDLVVQETLVLGGNAGSPAHPLSSIRYWERFDEA